MTAPSVSIMSDKTLFQKILDREIPAPLIYEDDLVAAFHDIAPQAPVHVLIVPRQPIPRVGAAGAGDCDTLGALLLAAGRIAEKLGVKESGFRLVINHGPHAGETVPHLHVHLLAGRELAWPPG